jgi:hypothetical protein
MVSATLLFALLAPAAGGGDDLARFLGKWRGDSICVARNTACHDETVVYRLADLPDKHGYVSVDADKIVNGSAINMGKLEFRYDQSQRMLVCEYSQGVWRFKLNAEVREGKLTRADGSEFRRVKLRKER